MRIALILQGLVDRTAVFHPLPVAGPSLLTPEHYDDGHVVLITDDEFQITTGRTPFYQWLAAKNAQMSPGMRVIVNTRHGSWPSRSTDHYSYDHHPRLHPPRAEAPSSTDVHTITKRAGRGQLSFTYARTREEWMGSGYNAEMRVPQTPASCTLNIDDRFVLPIDLVTVPEMREYLGARLERHAYEDMFPTLTAAIAFKEAEAEQEAPFRALLAAQIAAADSITMDEAAVFVDELVAWWKVGNRWNRALNGAPEAVNPARMILAEHAARVRAADGSDEASQTLAALQTTHRKALFVARKKDGTWVVGTASPRRWAAPTDEKLNRYATQVAPLDVFVDLAEYTPTGKPRPGKPWQVLEPAVVSRWMMLQTTPEWDTWNRRARRVEHLSDPEIEAAIATIRTWAPLTDCTLMAIGYDEKGQYEGARFEVWYHPDTGVVVPDRRLTDALPYVKSFSQTVTWKRDTDGAVQLHTPREPSSHSNTWHPRNNWRTDDQAVAVGNFDPPFSSDNRRHQTVFLDEQVLAGALAQAEAWDVARRDISGVSEQARALVAGIEQSWEDQAYAAAKARFLEDYFVEDLWEDHRKTLKVTVPFAWRGPTEPKGYVGTRDALAYLVNRLVEDARPPYGLTVADAFAKLGEELLSARDDRVAAWGRKPVTIAADVLALRFPDAPAVAGLLESA